MPGAQDGQGDVGRVGPPLTRGGKESGARKLRSGATLANAGEALQNAVLLTDRVYRI